jgi:sucrose-6-phosphate hydrolase SacC (GH32 family)
VPQLAGHHCVCLAGQSLTPHPPPPHTTAPQKHAANFPLYDPLHSLYHHFWQYHAATPPGHGPDIGHAVSADLVHWAHLPVAIWNNEPYDNMAIFTGSATIVNSVPTLVYPGLCNKQDWPACDTGTLLAIALPADHAGDPTLTNWTKPAYNPIVENTQRDPSTAWQTASGEWRMTNYEGVIFSSPDFVHWARASGAAPFAQAECPDFFPMPAPCQGNGCSLPSPPGAPPPTHVHKESSGGDWYTFGVYREGPNGTSGNWTPTAGMARTALDASQVLGVPMSFYASKSFLDPIGGAGGSGPRRIYWGWALVGPASTQTLPRVTTYHAALQRLIWRPLPELAALRGAALFAAPLLRIPLGAPASISAAIPAGAANRSETLVKFALPTAGTASFGLTLWPQGYGGAPGAAAGALTLNITFDAASFTANLTLGAPPPPPGPGGSYYMPGKDMPGGDLVVTSENYTDPHLCQLACNNTANCVGFTYVVRPPLKGDCCLKSSLGQLKDDARCTSGIKPGGAPPAAQGPHAPIPLLPGDTAIDLQVFMDSTFIEAYVMEGRQAVTLRMDGTTDYQVRLEAFAGQGAVATDVAVYAINPIWVPVQSVLDSRRKA